MYQNLFNGTFPAEIGDLLQLENLLMAYCGFSPTVIPTEFGKLKRLKFLWMTETNLIGAIPESLSNLSSLEKLDLSGNDLSGMIPQGLFSLNKF